MISFWTRTVSNRIETEALSSDIAVDVIVIGGGITGVSCAYLLTQAGLRVALLERAQIGSGEIRSTTAHLTHVTDVRLGTLVKTFGRESARAVWDAGRTAIQQIRACVEELSIDCDFVSVNGYLHAAVGVADTREQAKELQAEAELAQQLGFRAEYQATVPLMQSCGIEYSDQACFHPLKYLHELHRQLKVRGCRVFEGSEVDEFAQDPPRVRVGSHWIRAQDIVIATHVPLQGSRGVLSAVALQTKLSCYTSYVVGAWAPASLRHRGLFWDTDSPYHYLRFQPHHEQEYVIFGGEDNKTGQVDDPSERFERLSQRLHLILPGVRIVDRWMGQVVETHDGLPYIGRVSEHEFVATGFGGNGITFGTLAAMMARDLLTGVSNPWQSLFDPHRTPMRNGSVWKYVRENLDYPYYFVRDRVWGPPTEADEVENTPVCEGRVVRHGHWGHPLAVYRDPSGELTTLSATCPHLGCLVHWNSADQTWDCPCHGSRFQPTGEVLSGPAESPLARMQIAGPLQRAK